MGFVLSRLDGFLLSPIWDRENHQWDVIIAIVVLSMAFCWLMYLFPGYHDGALWKGIMKLKLDFQYIVNRLCITLAEVQKFGEIAKEPISVCNSSIKDSSSADFASMGPEIHEASSSCQLSSEETRQSDSCFMETQMHSLKQNISSLESKLEEATAMLKVKESRIVELEESGSAIELQQKQCREMETELEDLFKQKIEAEVEYLTLTRTIQKLRAGDQIMIYEEQKALAGEQAQMLNKLGEAEGKAAMLKKQAEKLETYCGDILGSEEVMKMEKRLCKVTLCFLIQLLLLLAFGLFVFQLPPHSSVVVPT
ncbi:WPP domain-interacting protein 2 [Vitis vinifera]|uniref:WPP domain-interacting protein 2 n=1 Tax=Vitis vinifera TaxID=29760 RepID=A0A438DU01_VITVI|nr:WPP domain-interacting protein 2 [Vitis vinifera]